MVEMSRPSMKMWPALGRAEIEMLARCEEPVKVFKMYGLLVARSANTKVLFPEPADIQKCAATIKAALKTYQSVR
jgi:hypothetical protein